MTFYLILVVLGVLAYAVHEFAVTRDLRPGRPAPERGARFAFRRSPKAAATRRFAPVANGPRLAWNRPAVADPASLTRKLRTVPTGLAQS